MLLEVKMTKRFGGLRPCRTSTSRSKRARCAASSARTARARARSSTSSPASTGPSPGGRIVFDGENITGREPHEIARRGVARTFQMLRIFSGMTVLENMLIGHHGLIRYGPASAVVGARARCGTRSAGCATR